jgi:uncharacterized membrane protein
MTNSPLPAPAVTVPDDTALERSVAGMLRIGVTLAAVIVLSGGAWLLRHPLRPIPDVYHFHSVEPSLRSLRGVTVAAFSRRPGQSRAIIQFGLLVLIATPIARVALCVFEFTRQRSWLYVGISAFVLAVLLWSLFGAV